jgi:hypothetical protein
MASNKNSTKKAKKSVVFGNSQVRNLNEGVGSVIQYAVPTHNFNGEGAVPSSRVQAEQKANPNAFNPVKRFNNTYRSLSKKENTASKASFLKVKSLYGDRWEDATVAIDTYEEEKDELEKGYAAKFMEIYAREIGGDITGNLASEIIETIEELNRVSLDLTKNKLSAEQAHAQLTELMQDGETILGVADFANKYKPFQALFLEHHEIHTASKLRRNKTLKNIKKNLAKRKSSVSNNSNHK